jgi:hypothetical protein
MLVRAKRLPRRRTAFVANQPCNNLKRSVVTLNSIETDFLKRLSLEPWTSPPVFDHGLLERMVRGNYVTTKPTGHGVYYEITDFGRAEALKAGLG